jgi:phage shock protein A
MSSSSSSSSSSCSLYASSACLSKKRYASFILVTGNLLAHSHVITTPRKTSRCFLGQRKRQLSSTHTISPRWTMNIFQRFFRIIRANVNQLLSGMEDPEKLINQTVTDMQSDLVKVRQAYAEVAASQKRLEKQRQQAQTTASEWYKRAQLALQRGEEGLAREALVRKKQQEEMAKSLEQQLALQTENMNKLYSSMQQLEMKINEARAKKDQYIARARTAKTSQKVNEMLGSVNTSSALEAFERMKSKVEELEASAEASAGMIGSGDANLERQFQALEGTSVDDELAQLKSSIESSSRPKSLPFQQDPNIEAELDRMKRERDYS